MLPVFILGIAVVIGLVLIARWYVSAEPRAVLKVLKWAGVLVVTAGVAYLAVTGRLGWAIGMSMVLLPWVLRALRTVRTARGFARMAAGGPTGQATNVETRFLKMTLDHDSGELDGEVLQGPGSGRRLGEMTLDELTSLLRVCRDEDEESAQILEAYLDRLHPDWRAAQTGERRADADRDRRGGGGAMSREEAYEVLGLKPGAGEAEIKSAYHRLIAGLHPDKGGSTFLAAKVNEAKDVLLGR